MTREIQYPAKIIALVTSTSLVVTPILVTIMIVIVAQRKRALLALRLLIR